MNIFQKEDYFFIIDSDSLENTQSRLYGFSLVESNIVTDENLGNKVLSGEGSYINVIRNEKEIVIQQDLLGSQGLYLYSDGNYFAVSNSFWMLADRAKTHGKLSFNRKYANAFLASDVCTYSFSETLINEIGKIDRSAEIIIDIPTGKISERMCVLDENTVDISSREGIELLDRWYEKWTSLIYTLIANDEAITVDLSGGFDTRMVFTLFLHPDIDLSKIRINSNSDKLHTHEEDFKIASQIAEKYGFSLNREIKTSGCHFNNSMEDILNIAFYNKLGFHKEMQWKLKTASRRGYQFSGAGGATIRSGFCREKSVLINNEKNMSKDIPGKLKKEVDASIGSLLEDACKLTVEKYRRAGREIPDADLTRFMYRETRNGAHFGKSIYDNFMGGRYKMCPLLDPDFQKIKLSSDECTDGDLLMAMVYIRYGRGIIDCPVQGGRSIKPETIAYAESVNTRYPYELKKLKEVSKVDGRAASIQSDSAQNPQIQLKEVNKKVDDLFYSHEIRDVVEKLYGRKMYKNMCYALTNAGYHKYAMAYFALSVYLADKAVKDSGNRNGEEGADSISSLNLLRPIDENLRYRPKNNILRKSVRFLERLL